MLIIVMAYVLSMYNVHLDSKVDDVYVVISAPNGSIVIEGNTTRTPTCAGQLINGVVIMACY